MSKSLFRKLGGKNPGLPFPVAGAVGVCGTLSSLYSFVTLQLLLTWESVFFIPFAEEVQSSSQTYNQQTHTENSDNYLLFYHWLNDKFCLATPVAVETLLTLAVVFIDVHQQHALAVVQAVIVKCAFTVLCRPLRHMRVPFYLPCR